MTPLQRGVINAACLTVIPVSIVSAAAAWAWQPLLALPVSTAVLWVLDRTNPANQAIPDMHDSNEPTRLVAPDVKEALWQVTRHPKHRRLETPTFRGTAAAPQRVDPDAP